MLRLDGLDLKVDDFRLQADTDLPKGQVTALMGPSGAGKSTLLSAVAGFLEPAAGRIVWDGEDMTAVIPGKRPVAMLFQDNNLFPHLSAAQNVGLGLRPDLRLSAAEKAQVAEALAKVGLDGLGGRKPAALSGGQQSRVALARVLVSGRPLVLLDEPFAALGPALKDGMLDLVRETLLAAGKTVVMVTHDPGDARRIADQIAVVTDGQVSDPVATDTLLANPPPALAAYLG